MIQAADDNRTGVSALAQFIRHLTTAVFFLFAGTLQITGG